MKRRHFLEKTLVAMKVNDQEVVGPRLKLE